VVTNDGAGGWQPVQSRPVDPLTKAQDFVNALSLGGPQDLHYPPGNGARVDPEAQLGSLDLSSPFDSIEARPRPPAAGAEAAAAAEVVAEAEVLQSEDSAIDEDDEDEGDDDGSDYQGEDDEDDDDDEEFQEDEEDEEASDSDESDSDDSAASVTLQELLGSGSFAKGARRPAPPAAPLRSTARRLASL